MFFTMIVPDMMPGITERTCLNMDKDKLNNEMLSSEEQNAGEAVQHDQQPEQVNTPEETPKNNSRGDGKKPRMFTQEEVNEIIRDRLARVKRGDDLQEKESEIEARETSLAEREAELSQRENRSTALTHVNEMDGQRQH